ncbi:HTTM domain-containing protein [Halobaculum sp. WSA2]|uniref:HTTM domain-containing protein n=1 Tax=Halobaculum saliterrae TaxID=2073113 RepID=A0A6B0T0N7_9EURY|nr:HTTM domain-containing protein [Halobaculum saliterrae]MXR42202.1 HTTM domain-containing protein [Halobaculum saliterrae]
MALRTRLTVVSCALRTALARRLFVDRRALAVLRVALGALLLADLLLRARSLAFFYTDAGVLPRSVLFARYPITSTLSLHAWFGGSWWITLLFVTAGVAALALALGYRTKVAAVCSLLLLVSLHARNPLVLNGGDSLLRRTLLWGLFVPLGTGLALEDRTRCRHPAAIGLLLQPIVLYMVNAVIKLRGSAWPSGRAVQMVFSIDSLTVLLGERLAAYPQLLGGLGAAWVVLLCCSPLLVLTTGSRRTAVVAVFAAAHTGMAFTLGVGLFPVISLAALLPYLPPAVWESIEGPWNRTVRRIDGVATAGSSRAIGVLGANRVARAGSRLTRRLGSGARAGIAAVPPTLTASGRLTGRIEADGGSEGENGTGKIDSAWNAAGVGRMARGAATALLLVVVLWNAAALGYIDAPETDAIGVGPQETRWDMFAPSPPTEDVWYVAIGTLDSGEEADVIHGGDPSLHRTGDRASTYPSARWRKYLEVVRWNDDDVLREQFASALCARWSATHRTRVETITVHVRSQPTRLDGPEPVEEVRTRRYAC